MKDSENVIRGIAISRKNFVELITVAVLLALGINLIAGQLLNWFKNQPTVVFLVGILLCLVSFFYALINLLGKRKKQISVQGFVVYDPIEKELVDVPGYNFADSIGRFISAAFFENAALKARWDKQPLMPFTIKPLRKELAEEQSQNGNDFDPEAFSGEVTWQFGKVTSAKKNATARLLCEAAEYFLIQSLSFHLYYYFREKAYKKTKLEACRREDIPTVLLSNPFLELFTRPKADRPVFAEKTDEDTGNLEDDENNYGFSVDNESGITQYLYHQFKLVLPKGSKVTRLPNHQIEIETKKLKMILSVKFETKVLAFDLLFFHFYLKRKPKVLGNFAYAINIDIEVSVKWHALLSISGWDYYKWVDSFLDIIDDEVSEQSFLDKIHWEDARTLLLCLENSEVNVRS